MLAGRLRYNLGCRAIARPRRLQFGQSRRYALETREERQILASIEGGLKSGPAEPMPEDAKGQAISAFRRIGLVLRAVVYGGLGLGVAGTLGFFGLHLWVEHLELAPGRHDDGRASTVGRRDDDYGWEEQSEGWGGGHLAKGTDPSLGWSIRALIRAAWVAQNWQSGQQAVAADQLPEGRLVDAAYALSESRLQQAILMAKQAGFKLEDRTLVELQLRLAHICERINTPPSLMKAYEIYSQLWKSCVDLSARFDPSVDSRDWEARQAIRIADQLGQLGLKIAALERQAEGSRAEFYQQAAENYLVWAISRGLGIGSSLDHSADLQSTSAQSKAPKGSTWSTFFGQHAREPAGQNDFCAANSAVEAHLAPITDRLSLLSGLPMPSEPAFKPGQLRLTISSLMNLAVHLVSVDMQKAFAIQDLIHRFVSAAVEEARESLRDGSADAKLHYHWLSSRAALSAVYLSEIGQAIKQMPDQEIIDRCRKALEIADSTIASLETEAGSNAVFQPGITRSLSGRLSEQLESLKRDVRLTGAMGATFLGLKYETCPSRAALAQSPRLHTAFNWCYRAQPDAHNGCQLARLFFQRAVDYSLGTSGDQSRHKQPLVLLNPLNENLRHLSRIDDLSKNT